MGVKVAVFLLAATVTSVFFIDFCALVFSCGCRSLWAGADAHCNIHTPGVPHCPFCDAAGYAVWAMIVAAQAVVAFRLRGAGPVVRGGLALLMFPIAGGIAAVIAGWATGYWAAR